MSRYSPIKFMIVGVAGFCVDAGILSVLIDRGAGLYSARLVSFPTAVTVTWYLNRVWSFKDSNNKGPLHEYASYLGVQVAASIANFLLYVASMIWLFNERGEMAVAALAIGAILGLIINYLGSRFLVFNSLAQPD